MNNKYSAIAHPDGEDEKLFSHTIISFERILHISQSERWRVSILSVPYCGLYHCIVTVCAVCMIYGDKHADEVYKY